MKVMLQRRNGNEEKGARGKGQTSGEEKKKRVGCLDV
jgi:hypothetical protein